MADALCGPSNALQNFQKHTTVDRTLQQDRLVGRHSPSQGFRSSTSQNAGALDSEFNAFQAGRPGALPQEFHHARQQFAPTPPPHFAQAPQAPGWASDFQRLNISNSPVQRQQPQAAHAASSWHQDFMTQQAPATHAPALHQQNTYGGMSGYNMGAYGGQSFMQAPAFQHAPVSQVAVPAFDEAAFEQAFLQAEQEAQQDMLDVVAEQSRAQAAQASPEVMGYDRPGEMDPLLIRIRETRPAVYSAIQVWSETGLGRTEEAVTYLENMAQLEQSGRLVEDANEAKWVVDSLQRIVNRDAPQEVKTRAESLITAINARLMSQYPLGARVPMSEEQIWQDLEAAGYMRTPEHERVQQQPEEQQKEEQPPVNDADEMAATAGRLLERVADNTSEKFQNSQFLELMRRLRDREVRVEEDKIVEVNEQSSAPPQQQQPPQMSLEQQQQRQMNLQQQQEQRASQSSHIPAIDPSILEHASLDFETPIYPQGTEQEQPI
ncbi:hypothetical protein CC86DRAFT_364995 [Ophiobolus disseminans]|uniref:Peroxin 20 n=1 Tax=Ophiobolus disseminans TaxID=1469910 RepID=A0A6A7AI99_9PLEO|nr:hypothetical protein CC86DRAFT_364995 [Ophiobolus disseminans]